MLFNLDRHSNISIQEQLRTAIVSSILGGQLRAGALLPSTRSLAKKHQISRTTVVLVYEKLVEDGFIVSANRSGFRVSPELPLITASAPLKPDSEKPKTNLDWASRFYLRPSEQRNITKPLNWQSYRYPFVYGQPDPALFPLAQWRECSRQAMSELSMRNWSSDAISEDDPQLVSEIKTKLLPKRGIFAKDDEILITAGAQNGLYLISALLMGGGANVAIEEPGYPDARNIFQINGGNLYPTTLDDQGAILGEAAYQSDYIFLTPSHHAPTTVSMSMERRRAFMDLASREDKIIIEDDFECEMNYLGEDVSALKAEDVDGRVIYLGSLSKSMFPGLRLGYVVADAKLIREMRALRRLMMRHVPSNNQRTTSLFLALGFHDAYVRKLNRVYAKRSKVMARSLEQYLPEMSERPTFGGTSYWLEGYSQLNSHELAERALKESIVIEPGSNHFLEPVGNERFFRLGFSSISEDRIEEGVQILSSLLRK
ncbi:PLP-dependent aminotransferase family protein [Sneathiella limimaris]|uniref:MocR-like pyridoxine biosynthesis transcription factor PdxR n=1 Tax=Sneathiella limimaris TaxID=1964213 RepID=UPI00146AE0F4|nr:PLP-dependent aminotransferase family protein [Sneathiella limimaris]